MDSTLGDSIRALRQQLAGEIARSLGPKAQHVQAPRFGIPQPRMSELSRGLVDRCSMEWLIRRIHRLGGSVSVTVALGDVRRGWTVRQFRRRQDRSAATPSAVPVGEPAPNIGDELRVPNIGDELPASNIGDAKPASDVDILPAAALIPYLERLHKTYPLTGISRHRLTSRRLVPLQRNVKVPPSIRRRWPSRSERRRRH